VFGSSLTASRAEFNGLLVDSVTEAISDVLGGKVNDAFWHRYETHLGITREEMPYRLDTLFAELKSAFGIGGETLGRLIVKRLRENRNSIEICARPSIGRMC